MADQFNITHTELRSVKLIFFLIYNELCRRDKKLLMNSN